MAFKDYFKLPKLFGANTKKASIPIMSRFVNINRSLSRMFGGKDDLDLYVGWVYACVEVISEDVADIELILNKRLPNGESEVVAEHPANELLFNPNEFFTKHELFKRLQGNKELRGNEYWFVEYTKGIPSEIFPLNPTLIRPIPDQRNYIKAYEYMLDGEKIIIAPENMIHFMTYNPNSDIVGVGTLNAARPAVETDEAAKEYNKEFFANGAQFGVLLEVPGALSEEDNKRLKANWNQEFAGPRKNYRTAVAANGLKVTRLEQTQADMEFIDQRNFSKDEILAIFRVPKPMIGILEDANRESAKTAKIIFADQTIDPKMKAVVDALNKDYLPLFLDPTLFYTYRSPVLEDQSVRVAYYAAGIKDGWLTPNEVRRREGFIDLQNGDTTFIPFNVVPGSSPTQKAIPPPKAVEKTAMQKLTDSIVVKMVGEIATKQNAMSDERFEETGQKKNQAQIRRAEVMERIFRDAVLDLFNDQRDRALKKLREEDSKGFRKAVDQNTQLLDAAEELELTIDLLKPLLTNMTEAEGAIALDFLGLSGSFIITPDIQKFIDRAVELLAQSMTRTTVDNINRSLTEGLEAGEDIDDITQRISDSTAFSPGRSERIARTEVTRASSNAEKEVWKESGLVTEAIWWTALDERVCPICAPLHGQTRTLDGPFITVDEMGDRNIQVYDGAIESPPAHPQCRCTLIPVIKDS